MKVLTYNIHGWRTADGAPNLALLAEVIAASDADLVGLNEVYHPWPTPDGPALAALASHLGMTYAFGPTLVDVPSPEGAQYGNAVLSRWPIRAYAGHHLAPVAGSERRGLFEARVSLPSGHPFTLYVTHLDHQSEEVRLAQWTAALTWLSRDRRRPHLLTGDFNALAPADYEDPGASPPIADRNAAQGWDPPELDLIRRVLKAGYVDSFALAGDRPGPTWPAAQPERRIDYVFVPEVWAEALVRASRMLLPAAREASDHLPVLAEFAV